MLAVGLRIKRFLIAAVTKGREAELGADTETPEGRALGRTIAMGVGCWLLA